MLFYQSWILYQKLNQVGRELDTGIELHSPGFNSCVSSLEIHGG
jgi:hypothetical protein